MGIPALGSSMCWKKIVSFLLERSDGKLDTITMRLTAEVIMSATVCMNPLLDREMRLRALKVPAIENLGVSRDQCDVLDLCDNEIRELGNFPLMKRLKTVLLHNNQISRIDPGIRESVPNLETLALCGNKISLLSEIDNLAGCKSLTSLSLVDNPICARKNYRQYVIHKLPNLKFLDFNKVKAHDREQAAELFGSGKSTGSQQSKSKFSESEKQAIKQAIAAAQSLEEVNRLELILKAGIIPDGETLASSLSASSTSQGSSQQPDNKQTSDDTTSKRGNPEPEDGNFVPNKKSKRRS